MGQSNEGKMIIVITFSIRLNQTSYLATSFSQLCSDLLKGILYNILEHFLQGIAIISSINSELNLGSSYKTSTADNWKDYRE